MITAATSRDIRHGRRRLAFCVGVVGSTLLLTWSPAHADLESPYGGSPTQGGTITLNAECVGEGELTGEPDPTWTISWYPQGTTTGTPNGSVSGPTTYDPVTEIVTGSLVIPADAPLGDTYVARWSCYQYANGDAGTYFPTSVFSIGVGGPTTTEEPTVTTDGPDVTEPAGEPELNPVLPSTGANSFSGWVVGIALLTAGMLALRLARRPLTTLGPDAR